MQSREHGPAQVPSHLPDLFMHRLVPVRVSSNFLSGEPAVHATSCPKPEPRGRASQNKFFRKVGAKSTKKTKQQLYNNKPAGGLSRSHTTCLHPDAKAGSKRTAKVGKGKGS